MSRRTNNNHCSNCSSERSNQRYLAKLFAFHHNHPRWRGLDENDELAVDESVVVRRGNNDNDDCPNDDGDGLLKTITTVDPPLSASVVERCSRSFFTDTPKSFFSGTPKTSVTGTPRSCVTDTCKSFFTDNVPRITVADKEEEVMARDVSKHQPYSPTISDSSPNSAGSFLSRLSPSTLTKSSSSVTDVSPQILRRIQWQMKNRKNKHSPNRTTGVEHPPQYHSEQHYKHHQPVITGGPIYCTFT